jgi:hypothetical protein
MAGTEQEWIDLYRRGFPRTRANGVRAVRALYGLLRDQPPDGFTVRDVAARAQVGLDTVARAVHHLTGLGVLSVGGGGWVAAPGGRPGRGLRHTYVAHWPPSGSRPDAVVRDERRAPADRVDSGTGNGWRYSGRRRIQHPE